MFLDDELEAIHAKGNFPTNELIKACLKRIPDPKVVGAQSFINEIRKIDSGWVLFAKRHDEYKEDGFRLVMTKHCHLTPQMLELFRWK